MSHLTGRASGRTAIEAVGLGKRYRRRWVLRDCTFRLPAGRICALAGPNGAGKTTLLSLASGLLRPDAGQVRVGGAGPDTAAGRARVAHVTQGKPLYPRLTVAETLRLGRELNPGHWNQARAEQLMREGRVPLDARVGSLSGGRRTRVALALALAAQPEILLLDEAPPCPERAAKDTASDVDPLLRHEVAGLLLAEAAERGTTIVMSSYALAELDGVCDYLLVLGGGRVRLAGEVDDVIGAHALLVGTHRGAGAPPRTGAHTLVDAEVTGRQFTALVRRQGPLHGPWEAVEPSLEEVLLGYLRAPDAPELIAPSAEPLSPRLRRTPGNKPGIPGMPRNGPGGRHCPPGGAERARHHHDSGGVHVGPQDIDPHIDPQDSDPQDIDLHHSDRHHSTKGAAA
ncbi:MULTISPECIES: ATP-binding cassette domain-containing protein [unclassified Streptomyces]|uniref:ATP-binding cassette domain-containing protein n=1 Tax=unclassified Streptomyces TaxID=2593676 RepID=UPI003821AC3B